MNISWSALLLVLVFITPAYLMLSLFKVQLFPKIRTIGPSDTTLFLVCSALSILFNFKILNEMAFYLISQVNYVEIPTWEVSLLRQLVTPLPEAYKLTSFFYSNSEHNLFIFILELHLRAITIGVIFIAILEGISAFLEMWEYLPYRDDSKSKCKLVRSFFDNALPRKVRPDISKFLSEKRSSLWFINKLNDIRASFYHPWSIITATNKRREILMVDILTTDDNLYSGKLSTWVPNNNEISAISIDYVIKYSPKNNSKDREKYLIKNHGELVIPASQIKTYHFWEIRKQYVFNITIKAKSDLEVLKWALLLVFVHDGFIKTVTAQFNSETVNKPMFVEIINNLNNWMNDNSILLPDGVLKLQYAEDLVKN